MERNAHRDVALSLLLAAGVAFIGIFWNSRFSVLPSGGVLTSTQAAQGISLVGWEEQTPGEWHFQFSAEHSALRQPLLLCLAGRVNLAGSSPLEKASIGSEGEFYRLPAEPQLSITVFATQQPQAWILTDDLAIRWHSIRTVLQLIALTAFGTIAVVILVLFHYKRQAPLQYFLLYLSVIFFWGLLVLCIPTGVHGLLWWGLRAFFAVTILAATLLSAALLGFPLRSGVVLPSCVVFLFFGTVLFPGIRFTVLMIGMGLCLLLPIMVRLRGERSASLILFSCALTTGLRVLALLPSLRSAFYGESFPLYFLRCARIYDLPFALGCMSYVCRSFALQFDRTEQLARELDHRVAERTHSLTEESNARKSMMLNIFHDLRSPLFAVSSGLDVLEETPEALPDLLPALQQRVGFVRRLTEDLFLAAKLEQKQILLNEDRVCLAEAAAQVCTACRNEAGQKGVRLSVSLPGSLPVWGDSVRLEQIVQNLLTNAIHYTPTDGQITVEGFAQDGFACISITDTGCGIAPEDQAFVFDRYFHTAADTKHDSSGLGLTIAQELAHLHHGEITLRSTVGSGSCFTLLLPLLEQQ